MNCVSLMESDRKVESAKQDVHVCRLGTAGQVSLGQTNMKFQKVTQ